MRSIQKGRAPSSFIDHAKTPGATYGNLGADTKTELRRALVQEQGGLCCYCMSKITGPDKHPRIEHWAPQSKEPKLQLDYRNLLVACNGGAAPGKKVDPDLLHCDRKKADHRISLDPRVPTHAKRLRYVRDGRIVTDDPALSGDVENRLNLNVDKLKRARKRVIKEFTHAFERRYPKRSLSRTALEREIERLEAHQSQLEPYSEVILYWLRNRAERE